MTNDQVYFTLQEEGDSKHDHAQLDMEEPPDSPLPEIDLGRDSTEVSRRLDHHRLSLAVLRCHCRGA